MANEIKKTPTQLKKKYKTIQYLCFGSEFVSVFAPFVAIGIANYDKYFVQYDGTKMSISFFMALAVMGIATLLVAKKKFENSFITLIVGWVAIAFIFTLMGSMITDISTIMWFGLVGIVGAYGLDLGSKYAKKKADEIDDAIATARKEDLVSQVHTETDNKKKIKVKIVEKKENEQK